MKKHIDWNAHIERQEAEGKRDMLRTRISERKKYVADKCADDTIMSSKENRRIPLGDGGFEVRRTTPSY